VGLPFRYERLDINQARFPDDRYDLVVNFSAGHHIACVDRVLRAVAHCLTDDGWFLNYDYVGPHRNQYPYEQWSAAWELNRRLPEDARQKLSYPHLPTMLVTDPSEAIHSELFLETFARYFTVVDYRPIGGALAYPLLTFNDALSALEPERREAVVATVLDADRRFLFEHPGLTLFAYWCGTVRRGVLRDGPLLDRWRREEDAREEAAVRSGGTYYPLTLMQALVYPELL
jgi:SAM-dependent methyltransferase